MIICNLDKNYNHKENIYSKEIRNNETVSKNVPKLINRFPSSRSDSKPVDHDLVFPITEISQMLQAGEEESAVSREVPVFLAAAEEYLAFQLIEAADKIAQERKHTAIEEEDIITAIHRNTEFKNVLKTRLE
nr:histone H2A-beta, sperm-like [Parasteatoda tepidariorum]